MTREKLSKLGYYLFIVGMLGGILVGRAIGTIIGSDISRIWLVGGPLYRLGATAANQLDDPRPDELTMLFRLLIGVDPGGNIGAFFGMFIGAILALVIYMALGDAYDKKGNKDE